MMCQRMGFPPISTIGLGRSSVSSSRRVPRPPQRIMACTGSSGQVSPDLRKAEVRVVGQPLDPKCADAGGVQERLRLAGPQRVVELVEDEERALRHPWQEVLERNSRRLVQVEIEEQQAHNQVRMRFDEARDGYRRVSAD